MGYPYLSISRASSKLNSFILQVKQKFEYSLDCATGVAAYVDELLFSKR
jgi:hypothetical protein